MDGSEAGEESEEIASLREQRRALVERVEWQRSGWAQSMDSLRLLLPDLVSSLELSLRVVSTFSHPGRPPGRESAFAPLLPSPLALALAPSSSSAKHAKLPTTPRSLKAPASAEARALALAASNTPSARLEKPKKKGGEPNALEGVAGGGGGRVGGKQPTVALSVVKAMVADCLLSSSTSIPLDSAGLFRRLPKDLPSVDEVGGGIRAVEAALKSLADANAGVELEEFTMSGKTRIMVLGVDRIRLSKELPNPNPNLNPNPSPSPRREDPPVLSGNTLEPPGPSQFGPPLPQRQQDMWGPPPQMFRGGPPPPRMMGMMGGIPPMQRPIIPPPNNNGMPNPGPSLAPVPGQGVFVKAKSNEDEDLKDLEALLSKKSFKELQQSKTGEELLDLLHRPTAKETAVAAKFKTKGGSVLKEYCQFLTKEDCRRQRSSMACEKVHFRRIIAAHTDVSLGDCSFLDTCRHMKTCKYVHYELDPTPDVPGIVGAPLRGMTKPPRAEYCSEVELGEPQWINCDIRSFRMDILGQFGVIMADPPWDIHMELPYGTMADDEMRNLNVPALQTDGLIFLWVTGRAMELGRECLELWGYRRVEELIWVKTNQLQRIIRTGRTGHWLNHSKEHCLIGIKGNPEVNRNIDTDVLVAEVRETSRKPDEMYPMLERISPRTRKLELFARMHNTHAGWISLGNQLDGVRVVDEGLRARFRAAFPDVPIQPPDPPSKATLTEIESSNTQVSPPGTKEMGETSAPLATENAAVKDKSS